MFKKIITSTILTLSFSLFTLTVHANNADDFTVSKSVFDRYGRYVVEFPPNWKITGGTDLGVDLLATAPTPKSGFKLAENAILISHEINNPVTAQEYFEAGLPDLEKLEGFKLGKMTDTMINGQKAIEVEYSDMVKEHEIKVLQYIVVKNKLVVVMTFGADPVDYPALKQIYQTIASTLVIN